MAVFSDVQAPPARTHLQVLLVQLRKRSRRPKPKPFVPPHEQVPSLLPRRHVPHFAVVKWESCPVHAKVQSSGVRIDLCECNVPRESPSIHGFPCPIITRNLSQ